MLKYSFREAHSNFQAVGALKGVIDECGLSAGVELSQLQALLPEYWSNGRMRGPEHAGYKQKIQEYAIYLGDLPTLLFSLPFCTDCAEYAEPCGAT